MTLGVGRPAASMARALAIAMATLGAGNMVPRGGRGLSAAPALAGGPEMFPVMRPPRVFLARELQSRRSRYMPHQGKRECLRRRLGGFAGVSPDVQDGRVKP